MNFLSNAFMGTQVAGSSAVKYPTVGAWMGQNLALSKENIAQAAQINKELFAAPRDVNTWVNTMVRQSAVAAHATPQPSASPALRLARPLLPNEMPATAPQFDPLFMKLPVWTRMAMLPKQLTTQMLQKNPDLQAFAQPTLAPRDLGRLMGTMLALLADDPHEHIPMALGRFLGAQVRTGVRSEAELSALMAGLHRRMHRREGGRASHGILRCASCTFSAHDAMEGNLDLTELAHSLPFLMMQAPQGLPEVFNKMVQRVADRLQGEQPLGTLGCVQMLGDALQSVEQQMAADAAVPACEQHQISGMLSNAFFGLEGNVPSITRSVMGQAITLVGAQQAEAE